MIIVARNILFASFLTVLAYGTVMKIGFAIYSHAPFYSTSLPRHDIESWTTGSFESFRHGQPLYSSIQNFKSPIYMSLPYQADYVGAKILSAITGWPEIGTARLLNSIFCVLAGLVMIFTVSLVTRNTVFSIVAVLAAFTIARDTFHIGYGLPHEMTKFFLAAWLSFLFYELATGKFRIGAGLLFIVLAPFVRQTFVFAAIFHLAIYVLLWLRMPSRGKYRFLFSRLAGPVILGLAALYLQFGSSAFNDVLFWILKLPSQHPKSFALIPSFTFKIASLSFLSSLILLFFARNDLRHPKLLAGAALVTYLTCLLHSAKQGSGAHMVDTTVFLTVLLVASASVRILQSQKVKWVPLILVPFLAWTCYQGITKSGYDFNILRTYESIRKSNAKTDAGLTAEEIALKSIPTAVSFFGEIPGYPNLVSGPWISSLTDASYSVPRYDQLYFSKLERGEAGQWMLMANLDSLQKLFPDDCRIKEKQLFAESSLTLIHLVCLGSETPEGLHE